MKKLFTLLAIVTTITIFAQAPQGFNYQATVRNSSGQLLLNEIVLVKFDVLQNSSSGTIVYSETQTATTDDLGHIALVVGQGTATAGTFSTINWGSGSYYLDIEFNTGTGYVAMGTTQLLSVPYALYAEKSGASATPGTNGLNALIKTTDESAGANCTNGGTKLEVGLDSNLNGVLDTNEINVSQTKYVCNGAQGAPGTTSSSIGANAAFSNAISTYYKSVSSESFILSSNGKYIIFSNPNYEYTIGTTRYTGVGEVYVVKYENGIFEQVGQKIQGVDAKDYLYSTGISGDGLTISVNSQLAGNITKIYKFTNNSWVVHSQINSDYANILSDDGNVIVGINPALPVGVEINRLNGTKWVKTQFTATDIVDYANGIKISADGNTIALANSNQNGVGRITIYRYINNAWVRIGNYIDGTLEQKLQRNFSLSKDGQKIAFAISGLFNYYSVSKPKVNIKTYSFENSNWIQFGDDIEISSGPTLSGIQFLAFNSTSDILLTSVNNDADNIYSPNDRTQKDYFQIFKFSNGNWNQYGSRIDLTNGFGDKTFYFESNIFIFTDNDLMKIKDYN